MTINEYQERIGKEVDMTHYQTANAVYMHHDIQDLHKDDFCKEMKAILKTRVGRALFDTLTETIATSNNRAHEIENQHDTISDQRTDIQHLNGMIACKDAEREEAVYSAVANECGIMLQMAKHCTDGQTARLLETRAHDMMSPRDFIRMKLHLGMELDAADQKMILAALDAQPKTTTITLIEQ